MLNSSRHFKKEKTSIKYILDSAKFDNRRYVCETKKLGQGAFSRVYKGWICECKTATSQGLFECSFEDITDVNDSYEKKINVKTISDDDDDEQFVCKCDKEIVQYVAIKKMHLTKIKSRKVLENEIDIMQDLNNPYIVNFIDVIKAQDEDETIFIILELCGGDFKEYVGNKRLKEKYARLFFKQIAHGLQYLHSKNIIHRDLKPQNILLSTSKRSVKIADFGFAKIIGSESLAETMCGSPLYMAPEIMRGKQYTSKADLWSVGVMMYEALTGFHPFQGANSLYDLIEKIERYSKRNQLKFPANVNLSWYARDLLKRLLRANPEERMEWSEFFAHKFFTDPDNNREDLISSLISSSLGRSIPKEFQGTVSPPSFISPTIPVPKSNGIGIKIINDYESSINVRSHTAPTKATSVPVLQDNFIRDDEYAYTPTDKTNENIKESQSQHIKPVKSMSYISDYIGISWSLLKDSIHSNGVSH